MSGFRYFPRHNYWVLSCVEENYVHPFLLILQEHYLLWPQINYYRNKNPLQPLLRKSVIYLCPAFWESSSRTRSTMEVLVVFCSGVGNFRMVPSWIVSAVRFKRWLNTTCPACPHSCTLEDFMAATSMWRGRRCYVLSRNSIVVYHRYDNKKKIETKRKIKTNNSWKSFD